MKKRSYSNDFTQRVKSNSDLYIAVAMATIAWMVVEFMLVFQHHYFEKIPKIILTRVANEVIFLGLLGWVFFLFAPIRKTKTTHFIVVALLCILLILGTVSTFYFIIAFEPISAGLLNFSLEEMAVIADDFFVFEWYHLLASIPLIVFFLVRRLGSRKGHFFQIATMCAAVMFSVLPSFQLNTRSKNFAANKQLYFVQSFFETKNHHELTDVVAAIQLFQVSNAQRKFIGSDYPFLHQKSQTSNLAPYFSDTSNNPNVVFIIVESLSAPFSGPLADELSFTPFLDSLSEHALYFPNFLATAERTFAVLPSILASLPHGQKGFTTMDGHYPQFSSFPHQLFEQGYTGRFFYGGHAGFDKMGGFMEHIGFSSIIDREEYNYEGTGLVTSKDPVPFGIGDREMLLSSFNEFSADENPYLHVYLTLSMHYPYVIDEPEYYREKARSYILRQTEKGSAQQRKLLKYQKELATFFYTDDALRNFFQVYSERNDFDNTIFIIVGDHMMSEIAQKDDLEKYRIPCYIYSALLKEKGVFPAVNSHLDLAPALSLLFEHNYAMPIGDSVHWLGDDLDLHQEFRNLRTLLFMRNKRGTEDLIAGNFYLSENTIYPIGDRNLLLKKPEENQGEHLKRLIGAYRLLHKYTTEQGAIIPFNTPASSVLLTNISARNQLLNTDAEFIELDKIILNNQFASFTIDIDLVLDDELDAFLLSEQPILIITFTRTENEVKENIEYFAIPLDEIALRTNEDKVAIRARRIMSNAKQKIQPGDELSIYLWNKEMISFNYLMLNQTIRVEGHND